MITSNPYNLPDKILKPNPITKPITLQNKKSRDRSYDLSKQLASKGIKIQSQMKKSLNLQHITSSPNLHTPSTSSSTNRLLESPNLHRPIEYLQTHIQPVHETQNDRRIKFLFEKFYQIHEQLTSHDSLLNKLVNDKDKERNTWDSPFQINGASQKESRDKDEILRNTARSFHINGQTTGGSPTIQLNQALSQIDQIKKQISHMKQHIYNVKTTIAREKDQQNNTMNSSKRIKFNSNIQHQTFSLQRRFAEDFSRIYQALQQIKVSTHEKFIKIQNSLHKMDGNGQIVGHKVNKAQEKIDNIELSIQNHMKLVNQEINNALTKIVASINEKISKALQNNVVLVNEKLKKCIQTCKNLSNQEKKTNPTLRPSNMEGKLTVNSGMILKLSGYRAQGKVLKIKLKSLLTVQNQTNQEKSGIFSETSPKKGEYSPSKSSTEAEEIVLSDTIYHIDADGYLMDENKIYLIDQNNNLLHLETDKLTKIKESGFLR